MQKNNFQSIIRLQSEFGYFVWRSLMSSFTARMEIPDAWAAKGRCPICNNSSLCIAHQPGFPDEMDCSTCGCAFEVESDGPAIRLVRTGPEMKLKLQAIEGTWVSAVDLHRQLYQPAVETPAQQVEQVISIKESAPAYSAQGLPVVEVQQTSTEIPDQAEVNKRVLGLAELGNRPDRIKSTLSKAGIPDEMVDIALDDLKTHQVKRKSPLPLALAITIIVIVGCLSAVAIYLPKFNLRSLTGFVNMPVNPFDKNQSGSGTPVPPGAGLPADGYRYFNTIWNLTGQYSDKTNQIASLIPPVGLESVHAQLITSFGQVSQLESTYQKCLSDFNQLNCSDTQVLDNGICKDKAAECSAENLSFLQEQTLLYTYWLGTACKSFEDYYSTNKVEFPFPSGECKYP